MELERSVPQRIAYFAGTLRPGHDGVTRVLYRLIDALQGRGVESLYYSPILPDEPDPRAPMIKVRSLPIPFNKEYRCAFPGAGFIDRSLSLFRPDLLHIHTPCPLGLAAVAYGRRHGVPVVATYHTHFLSYARYYGLQAFAPLGWAYVRDLYNQCAKVYVPSAAMVGELRARGIRGLELLPHGVDTQAFNPSHRSQAWIQKHGGEGRARILYAGRLVPEKDLATLAEVYRRLSCRRSDWVLVVAGDGPARLELERSMPGALFLGHLTGKALSAAYASSEIFLFPSPTETFGNVVLEAMASGLVPVCVREGGAGGSVREGVTGFLASPRDPADIVRCVETLLDSTDRRAAMGVAAVAHARGESWERVFDRLFGSYAEICRFSSRWAFGGGQGLRTPTGGGGSSRRRRPRRAGTPRPAIPEHWRTWQ